MKIVIGVVKGRSVTIGTIVAVPGVVGACVQGLGRLKEGIICVTIGIRGERKLGISTGWLRSWEMGPLEGCSRPPTRARIMPLRYVHDLR